jgi:hypothetical protein
MRRRTLATTLAAPLSDGIVDIVAVPVTELGEEVGVQPADVCHPVLLGFDEHVGMHVIDIGIALFTQLHGADILATHWATGHSEYDLLIIVPHAEISGFLARGKIVAQAPLFLAELVQIVPGYETSRH